ERGTAEDEGAGRGEGDGGLEALTHRDQSFAVVALGAAAVCAPNTPLVGWRTSDVRLVSAPGVSRSLQVIRHPAAKGLDRSAVVTAL
ncbi:hypothetical protein, partial [Curtobacterium flaccumfaciens]|uniref:hypothetical protein n=1 Tax=Curtobacterium flaccumfaciens TaxID=2035 RepID=UPI00217D581D